MGYTEDTENPTELTEKRQDSIGAEYVSSFSPCLLFSFREFCVLFYKIG